MIGRGHVTFLDDAAVLRISKHVRRDLARSLGRDEIYAVHPDVRDLINIAEAIEKSVVGRVLERSDPAEAVSDRDLLTVRQAETLLPWGAHEIRRKIRAGEIPIKQRDPYLLDRDAVLAINASLDQGAA